MLTAAADYFFGSSGAGRSALLAFVASFLRAGGDLHQDCHLILSRVIKVRTIEHTRGVGRGADARLTLPAHHAGRGAPACQTIAYDEYAHESGHGPLRSTRWLREYVLWTAP